MKTRMIIFLAIALNYAHVTFANDSKYAEAMSKNIQTVYTAQSIPELQSAVNALERIASTEKTKWEPYYYAAFGYIMIANREQDGSKKDVYLDQATTAVSKAKAILANESEIIALEGFIYMIRVTVDPVSRGQQYSGLAMRAFDKASSLNPENPRALMLMGQMQYGTAQFLGSSTTDACASIDAALQKFATFKSDNPFAPQWGRATAEGVKAKCK